MKVYLNDRNATGCLQDEGMVVVALDAERAKNLARRKSHDFANEQYIEVTEIDMTEKQCILTSNTGA